MNNNTGKKKKITLYVLMILSVAILLISMFMYIAQVQINDHLYIEFNDEVNQISVELTTENTKKLVPDKMVKDESKESSKIVFEFEVSINNLQPNTTLIVSKESLVFDNDEIDHLGLVNLSIDGQPDENSYLVQSFKTIVRVELTLSEPSDLEEYDYIKGRTILFSILFEIERE